MAEEFLALICFEALYDFSSSSRADIYTLESGPIPAHFVIPQDFYARVMATDGALKITYYEAQVRRTLTKQGGRDMSGLMEPMETQPLRIARPGQSGYEKRM